LLRRLYLDTARLGLMRPGAQRLYQDFVRFAGEEGCTLYWEDFLRFGGTNWPAPLKSRYPALTTWQGMSHLKESLKCLVGACPDSEVLLANRSAELMKLTARLLFGICRNVMVTDLSWPAYLTTFKNFTHRSTNILTAVQLRGRLLTEQTSSERLVEYLAGRFVRSNCDGLFLPAVDHSGIRLPIGDIVRTIRNRTELRFVVVDGAQALAHVPLSLNEIDCDFFIAGCHKWLGAFHPLGLGFFGHPRSSDDIRKFIRNVVRHRIVDDPLLCFTEELENGATSRFGETVNVSPMLTAQGAINDCDPDGISTTLSRRITNADRLLARISGLAWRPRLPVDELRSGILLLQATDQRNALPPANLRRSLHEQGIAATTYKGGLLRLSMPHDSWSGDDLDCLSHGLNVA